jgi:hypothetical protein
MGDLTIRIRDASREPLGDLVDVDLLTRDGGVFRQKRGQRGTVVHKFTGLEPLNTYTLRVFPLRHRPVQRFVGLAGKSSGAVDVYCPVEPDRAKPGFPAYKDLDKTARDILERSEVESYPAARGAKLYDQLPDEPKAGLLNLVSKMAATRLDDKTTTLDQVESIYRLRGDRLFADVKIGMRDKVISANQGSTFRLVSGSLHHPDTDFTSVDSYKTLDGQGNLQLTFFRSLGMPMRYRADIDIDDAAGLQHVFDVIEHTIKDGRTHPYDIHQILTFYQLLDPGYTLTA